MKILLRIPTLIVILCLSVINYSCESDNPVAPVANTVNGKVYSVSKATLGNLSVTIQNKSTTTSSDGSFSLNNIVFPYDVVIADETGEFKTLYRSLNTSSPELIMSFIDRAKILPLEITIPDSIFYKQLSILIIFSDGKNINDYRYIKRQVVPSRIGFGLGSNTPEFSGKLYLLTFKHDNEGRILSYENFGVSDDIDIFNMYYTFTAEQISFNPAELDVPVTINSTANTNFAFCKHYIGFSKEKIYNGVFETIQTFVPGQLSVRIPADLPVQSYNFLDSYSNSATGGGTEQYLLDPAGQNTFTVKDNPSLLTPVQNATVTDTTNFTTPGDGTGIYNIVFYDSTSYTSVFQSQTSIKFSDVKSLIQLNGSSNQIGWYVSKLGEITSPDNFIDEYFRKQSSFKTGSVLGIFNY
ncbi:MAG: carboxypeptidase regulatory-like domain-containing protein [Ignavibacteria bacterium]|nr:carboxypeptidase regulatory-like domain-containing protein [Ignavibacteria bacterium]